MKSRKLLLDKSNSNMIDYIGRLFDSDNLVHYERRTIGEYVEYDVDLPSEYLPALYRFIAKSVILSEKYDFVTSRLKLGELNYAKVTFLMALVFFDIKAEIKELAKNIQHLESINSVGVADFCMTRIKADWVDVIDLVEVLAGGEYADEDMYSVVSFLLGTRSKEDKSIFLADFDNFILTNVTDGIMIENYNFFDNPEYNLISAVIEQRPKELIVEKGVMGRELYDTLSHITDINVL